MLLSTKTISLALWDTAKGKVMFSKHKAIGLHRSLPIKITEHQGNPGRRALLDRQVEVLV